MLALNRRRRINIYHNGSKSTWLVDTVHAWATMLPAAWRDEMRELTTEGLTNLSYRTDSIAAVFVQVAPYDGDMMKWMVVASERSDQEFIGDHVSCDAAPLAQTVHSW